MTLPPLPRRRPGRAVGLAAALAVALSVGAAVPAHASPADPALADALTAVLDDPRVENGTTGLRVVDEGDGTVLFDRHGSTPLIPASNTKLLTGAAALDTLGGSYRFHTDVLLDGEVSGRGVLRGDLVLKGYGDPTALAEDYADLAEQVRAAGIRTVTGRVLADDTYFEQQAYHPGWDPDDAPYYYAAQISALTLAPDTDYDSGTVIVETSPGTDLGEEAAVQVVPASAAEYVEVVNRTTTVAAGEDSTLDITRNPDTNQIVLTGRVPADDGVDETWVTVDQPELLAATVFAEALADEGVRVRREVAEGTAGAGARRVARDESMPLSELMTPFMKLSNNMHAETLVKTMAAQSGQPGSWTAGVALVEDFVADDGVDVTGLSLADGSGLARANRISPTTLTSALRAFTDEPWFEVYRTSLPVAGVPERFVGGTLRSRMRDTPAAGNLRGKTGSLTGVTALSGYVSGADGRDYVFAMISNYRGSSPRAVEDEVGVTLAGWTAQTS
ncbi:D-alanyl-D-alanine carboxypeptidase/D-alanyl-D-alanine endopeptidase [Auraticoccus cholistanensis]|uniref:D-alanyl-D-alanine carboxypeptidase/D-alanyl-D-alanine endopeptidase n=1 Tax=Auraticoccus cholistanensis TaxID=2656650 RepID=UPI0018D22FBE